MSRGARKTAVVLSGGGAYGAFGVGVMKGLAAGRSPATDYRPFDPDILTGTSVGAFNATALVAHPVGGLEAAMNLEEIWTRRISSRTENCGNGIFRIRGDVAEYLTPGCSSSARQALGWAVEDGLAFGRYVIGRTANFLAASSPIENRALGLVDIGAFIDTAPLARLLREVIDPRLILNSRRRLNITATNWVTGEAIQFDNADFIGERGYQAIRASTAIPGIFSPVSVEGEVCVDGGVVQNTPLDPAIKLGATELHVVYLNPDPRFLPILGSPNTIDTMLRVYFVMLATKLAEDIETARWINEGLDALAKAEAGASLNPEDATDLLRVAGRLISSRHRPYQRVVIHRYFPRAALGGDFGMLNFGLEQVLKMIDEGEHSALTHNCVESDCVLV